MNQNYLVYQKITDKQMFTAFLYTAIFVIYGLGYLI